MLAPFALGLCCGACERPQSSGDWIRAEPRGALAVHGQPSVARLTPVAAPAREGPIRIEPLRGIEPPVFGTRGGPRGAAKLVFLHGMCGHGMGYAQSFQFSAARHGTLISPQGDVVCGSGPWAKWSRDLEALDRRVADSFAVLGVSEPLSDIVVLGYSMGATRALELARKWPERYSRLILMGAPGAPSPAGLGRIRGAVMMAGERDRQDHMRRAAAAFQRAGIPSTFILIPEARHGAMGPTPERTMGEALDWLVQNQKPAQTPGPVPLKQ